MSKRILLIMTLVGLPLALGFAGDAIQSWHYAFDDAFITYRYAKNLAFGYGITWNPGMAPTEGYTNFLLVVFLAPFIRVGYDPLIVTRILSYASALYIAVLLFYVARRYYAASVSTALMIAALVFTPQTSALCLLGLETVVYSLVLLVAFHLATQLIRSPSTVKSALLGVVVILAMLLRPEAALLYIVTVIVYAISSVVERKPHKLLHLAPCTLVMVVLGGAYLVWKAFHFEQLLPNPFYIKAAGTTVVSRIGWISVTDFADNHALFLSVFFLTFVLSFTRRDDLKQTRITVLGLSFLLAYGVFFMRTDTFMDINGRFMFPLVPVLIYSSIPLLTVTMQEIQNWIQERKILFSVFLIAFMLAFAPDYPLNIISTAKRLKPSNSWKTSNSLGPTEYRIAKTLAEFPEIQQTRVAGGDAGVMPYFSEAIWLDTVGLNDSFIARTHDRIALVDYIFEWQPDLVLIASNKDHSWPDYGHGHLGDINKWSSNPRWDRFQYVGTCRTAATSSTCNFSIEKMLGMLKS